MRDLREKFYLEAQFEKSHAFAHRREAAQMRFLREVFRREELLNEP